MISPIVQSCDAISGSRPGARREVMDSYIKRLREKIDDPASPRLLHTVRGVGYVLKESA